MLEGLERGFWETDQETLQKLQDIYLEAESELERIGYDDA
jgi:cobalamin biosynthesis Mg chelatase CobN